MEALTAVSVAALTLYDMIKAVDPAARIDDIRVLRKEGGKTGTWTAVHDAVGTGGHRLHPGGRRASTRTARGPIIVDWLNQRGIATPAPVVVADGVGVVAALFAARRRKRRRGHHFRRHRHLADGRAPPTPPPTSSTIRSPALPTRSGARGCRTCRRRCCPAAYAACRGRTLIVNLPGSTGGVKDGLGVLDDVLEHALDQLAARTTRDDRRRAARRTHRAARSSWPSTKRWSRIESAGAVVGFAGVVRDHDGGRTVIAAGVLRASLGAADAGRRGRRDRGRLSRCARHRGQPPRRARCTSATPHWSLPSPRTTERRRSRRARDWSTPSRPGYRCGSTSSSPTAPTSG